MDRSAELNRIDLRLTMLARHVAAQRTAALRADLSGKLPEDLATTLNRELIERAGAEAYSELLDRVVHYLEKPSDDLFDSPLGVPGAKRDARPDGPAGVGEPAAGGGASGAQRLAAEALAVSAGLCGGSISRTRVRDYLIGWVKGELATDELVRALLIDP